MSTIHTPLPWRTAGSGLQIKAKCNDILIASVEGPDRRARGKEWQEDHDYCHGNAAFIVKAVNCHENLVSALSEIVKSLADSDEEGLIEHTETMMRARSALAAAGAL